MVLANYYAATYAMHFPEIHGGHEAWRYTLISGVLSALPLILIRPFPARVAGMGEEKSLRHFAAPEYPGTFQSGVGAHCRS